MANASLETLLSIERFRQIVGINPYHFHGIVSAAHPLDSFCDKFWCQRSWMSESETASRENLSEAIDGAERLLANFLGYWMAPRYTVAENVIMTQYYRADVYRANLIDARGRGLPVQLGHGHFIEGGQETLDLVQAGVAVTYLNDWGTLAAVPYATGSACEIKVFHAGQTAEALRVRPIEVTVTGGQANIRARQWLLADPSLWLETCLEIDGDDPTSFVETVDVYRAYTNPETQAQFHWEPDGLTCSADTAACGCTVQSACLAARDHRLGQVVPVPASYSAGAFTQATLAVCRQPDRVRAWYRSGLPTQDCLMQPEWARTAAYLAVTLLDRKACMCACDKSSWFLDYWRAPYAVDREGNLAFLEIMNNPFGYERGSVHAWRKVKPPGGVALGGGTHV